MVQERVTQFSGQAANMAELMKGQVSAVVDTLRYYNQAQSSSSPDTEDFLDASSFENMDTLSEDFVIKKATDFDLKDGVSPPSAAADSSSAETHSTPKKKEATFNTTAAAAAATTTATTAAAATAAVSGAASGTVLGTRAEPQTETGAPSLKAKSQAGHAQASAQKQTFSTSSSAKKSIISPPVQKVRFRLLGLV